MYVFHHMCSIIFYSWSGDNYLDQLYSVSRHHGWSKESKIGPWSQSGYKPVGQVQCMHLLRQPKVGESAYYNTGVSKSSEGFLNSGNGWEEEESLIKKMVHARGLARWLGFDRQNGRKGPLWRIICVWSSVEAGKWKGSTGRVHRQGAQQHIMLGEF